MGLAISVGLLDDLTHHDQEGAAWLQGNLRLLNQVLADNNLPPHVEPEQLSALDWHGACTSFPYSFLHYLRRAYCCVSEKQPMRTGSLTAEDEAFISDVAVSTMDSALLMHSDAEGYYIPIELDYPLCDDRLPGGFLCSTQNLLRELKEVAPAIGIQLQDGMLTETETERLVAINGEDEQATPLFRECIVWFTLFQACNHSITHRSLIVFH